ncbi:MAG: hypothetical protein JEY99_08200 [Spirochaetales bacterium]|nr:hypothetical protein [Spirochaetales bacterium]
MKKNALVLFILTVCTLGLFAAGPDYFAFEIGAGGAFDVDAGDIVSTNSMGFYYTFNETFAGGFSFTDIAGNDVSMVTISVSPLENLYVKMNTGQITSGAGVSALGFGAGFGYDFLTKKSGLFTSLGLYFDWYADNAGVYDIADGGVMAFGLKTRIGL